MGGFGFSGEMIFLFFLALILFGPKKLPEMGRQIGRLMNEFRRASNEFRSQIESEINAVQSDVKPQILPPLQAPLGSLASRIFNPPSGAELEAAEAKIEAAPPASESSTSRAGVPPVVVEASHPHTPEPEPVADTFHPAANAAPKAAPDA